MKDKFTSRKFLLSILGLVAMLYEPSIANSVVTLIGLAIGGFSLIDYQEKKNQGK